MAKEAVARGEELEPNTMDLRHLRRDARTALELAVVAPAPPELVDRLAMSAGLLEALEELPTDSAPVKAIVSSVVARARGALREWDKWKATVEKIPRG
jgi:hypothetical protein